MRNIIMMNIEMILLPIYANVLSTIASCMIWANVKSILLIDFCADRHIY